MRKFRWLLWGSVSLFSVTLLFGGACRGRQQAPQQPEYAPTATIKDLMLSIIDPSADVVWESVGTVITSAGTEERFPRTDEEWANVRGGAIRLVEAPNLLMIPGRHVARPGEKSETPGVELEPGEMDALIAKDWEAWSRRAKALRDVSLEMLQAIDAKDKEKMLDVGGRLDVACEGCHTQYWYPNEKIPPGPTELKSGAQ